MPVDDTEHEPHQGEIPHGVGPEVFRERLEQVARDATGGAEITFEDESIAVEDIERVEAEPGGHRSRIHLRNGAIIGGLTGAAIVAAIATIRFKRHRGD